VTRKAMSRGNVQPGAARGLRLSRQRLPRHAKGYESNTFAWGIRRYCHGSIEFRITENPYSPARLQACMPLWRTLQYSLYLL